MSNKYILSLLMFLLCACSGPSSADPITGAQENIRPIPAKITLESVPMILGPSEVPPEPDPEINNSTVAGVDSNNNGIRDDVERWIAQTYPTSAKMRAAVAQEALNSQKELSNKLTKDSAYQIGVEGMNATHCVSEACRSTGLRRDIKEYMSAQYNTRSRSNAYLNFQEIMGSRAFMVPEIDTCDISVSQLPN